METVIIFFLSFTAMSFFFIAVRKEKDLQEEKREKYELIMLHQKMNDLYISDNIELRNRMIEIQRENIRLVELMKYENSSSPTRISKDTIDAVFYAMKKSHPDNGGKEEDFIRFKKCYEKLTK